MIDPIVLLDNVTTPTVSETYDTNDVQFVPNMAIMIEMLGQGTTANGGYSFDASLDGELWFQLIGSTSLESGNAKSVSFLEPNSTKFFRYLRARLITLPQGCTGFSFSFLAK